MFKRLLSLFLVLLISCGGGGGGGGDTTEPTDPPPVAIFTGSPVSGTVPLTVNFISASTNASSYGWDFENDGFLDAGLNTVSHTYNSTGTYSVSLTVTNSTGSDTDVKIDYITVNAVVPTASFFSDQSSGTNPLRVKFTNTSTYYSSSSWDFGDGATSTEQSPIHTYTSSGSYNVSLNVTGEGGTNTYNNFTIDIVDISTPAMIVDSKYVDISSGGDIALDIKILGASGLSAAQAKLAYDPSLLTLGEITPGDFFQGNTDPLFIITKDENNGEITIYTSSLSSDQPTSNGDGVIATINFTVDNIANTNINFDSNSTLILNADGEGITINGLENGYLIAE